MYYALARSPLRLPGSADIEISESRRNALENRNQDEAGREKREFHVGNWPLFRTLPCPGTVVCA